MVVIQHCFYLVSVHESSPEFRVQLLHQPVSYLGHVIDSKSLHPLSEKVEAIRHTSRYLPIMENSCWIYQLDKHHSTSSRARKNPGNGHPLKTKRSTNQRSYSRPRNCYFILTHLLLLLAWDTSAYGVGAVLAYRMSDNSEKQIGYASHSSSTLNSAASFSWQLVHWLQLDRYPCAASRGGLSLRHMHLLQVLVCRFKTLSYKHSFSACELSFL